MHLLASGFFLTFWALAASADDNTACAQACLGHLGYDVGPVDGLLGPRTAAAAEAYLDDTGIDLPPLAKLSVGAWCDHAESDARYQEFLEFEFGGSGIVLREVAFAALQADEDARNRAYGAVAGPDLDRLEQQESIHRISGFNSRMDNPAMVPGAREAEEFAERFGHASVATFARHDEQARTRLVRILAKRAANDEFLGAISCVKPDGHLIDTDECREWRQPDGQDLSGMKDATHSTFLIAGLVRTYLALLSDHEKEALAEEHASIAARIADGFSARLRQPSQVYFGLNVGWYWPSINLATSEGRTDRARQLLRRLERGAGASGQP